MSLMVMQSRKCFRLNDGYFDKKSSNHHLEDSMSKYSSKGLNNSFSNSLNDSSSHGKHRRTVCSPLNGSNSRSRSISPDNWSPNRGVYANKSSYGSRVKERSRDRDRGGGNKYYNDKLLSKKSSNCRSRSRSRSPLEFSKSYKQSVNNHTSRDDLHSSDSRRLNNNNNSSRVWSEQKSSSGKIYYFNHKTKVSQWEKPDDFKPSKYSKSSSGDNNNYSYRDNNRTDTNNKSCVNKTYSSHELSSGYRQEKDRTKSSGGGTTGSTSSNSNSSIRSQSKRDDELRPSAAVDRLSNDSKRVQQQQDYRNSGINCVKRESLKSPNESSNNICVNNNNIKTNFNNNNNDVNRTHGSSGSNHNYNHSSESAQQLLSQISLSPTQTQNLQKLLMSSQGLTDLSVNFSEETLRALQQALQLTVKATDSKLQSVGIQSSRHRTQSLSQSLSSPRSGVNESPVSTSSHHHRPHHLSHHHIAHHNQHHSSTSHSHYNQTHQSADGIRQELDLLISRANVNKSPNSEKSVISSTRHDQSPPPSVTNLSAMSSASLKPSVPSVPALTPILANFYREELVSHVTGWQAEHAEKQAKTYSQQSHDYGSHQCTRVSAELKMARSLVRLTEIQSTLQEQRIIFATQQIKNVEEWKGQNANHSSYHS